MDYNFTHQKHIKIRIITGRWATMMAEADGLRSDGVSVWDSFENSINTDKFKQVLHYIIHKTGSMENVGKTVLFKILYFTDFNFYEKFEEKLTGELYRKIPHGPAPCHFDSIVEELSKEKLIRVFETFDGRFTKKKYISFEKPNLSLLSANELQFIDESIDQYSKYNATQISEYSHKDMPYRITNDSEIIDYELVFYRDSMFSVREYEDGGDC